MKKGFYYRFKGEGVLYLCEGYADFTGCMRLRKVGTLNTCTAFPSSFPHFKEYNP